MNEPNKPQEPDRINPFQILKNRTQGGLTGEFDRRWEHARVRYTLQRLRLTRYQKEFLQFVRQQTDETYYNFRLFDQFFPSFPIALACDRLKEDSKEPLHRDPKAFHPQWWKNFMRLPFIPAYQKFYDSIGAHTMTRHCGLVFPRRGFQQGLVVHNGEFADYVSPGHTAHVYLAPDGHQMLFVQPFQNLLDHIWGVSGWRHDPDRPDDPVE
jgi:hypothetical protein